MAKGGSSQTETTMPKFAETGLQRAVGMGTDLSQMGYVPYYGPDVAAFSPMEQASFQGTDMMASAFGMPASGGQQYMPQAQSYAGGVQGYSSQPLYQQSVDTLAAERPAQANYLASFGIDPVTGEVGSRAATQQPVALEMQAQRGK